MLSPAALLFALFFLFTPVHGVWELIASNIGGSPLGVSCYEDLTTCITATSQVIPAGYEVKRSTDGGRTWGTVPDQDLFIFALYNSAVFGDYALISGMEFIQKSTNKGLNFTSVPGSLAIGGGEIVRKLYGAQNTPVGFAILGLTNDDKVNGLVYSAENVAGPWVERNIGELNAGVMATDGFFFQGTWLVVGEEYETAASRRGLLKHPHHQQQQQQQQQAGSLVRPSRSRSLSRSRKAIYATQVVSSTDQGATWTTLYYNTSVATLGMACIDPLHCCLVQEDADYAYVQCTQNGFTTPPATTLTDGSEGAALVEVAVDAGGCYAIVGGAVSGGGQSPIAYHSCDKGLTWSKDTLEGFPFDLLFTDIDCVQGGGNASAGACFATLWDDSGIDPNGFVAKWTN